MTEQERQDFLQKLALIRERENNFRRVLALKGMKITDVEGDGNCLFRAVSDQVYKGNQNHHELIR